MENEIPFSQEKTKPLRLREARRRLQDLPLDRPPTDAEWESITGDLTRDDLDRLPVLAQGHLDRAAGAVASGSADEVADEARSAVLLRPRDPAWPRVVARTLAEAGWTGPEAREFTAALQGRTGKKPRKPSKIPRWIVPTLVILTVLGLVAWGSIAFWPGVTLGPHAPVLVGPRTIEAAFDTQGVKTNIEVAKSRMIVFPEASVAELSAWVTFPEHRVEVWEGTVSVLDAQGKSLATRDLTFLGSDPTPLDPGQGLEVFQQFDAWPWFNRAASFQVVTTRILAREANPVRRTELPVTGIEALTPGYRLKVWTLDGRWTDRFASKVHTLELELENTGLKPFTELRFALVWVDPRGRVLKTQDFRPVSPFRTALPSGARLPWQQESVFDTEVFTWPAGGEPHPVLELKSWQ